MRAVAAMAPCGCPSVSRWFQETLKEVESGNTNMQVMVSQMYYKGYCVPIDARKGKFWMTKASKKGSWVWAVSEKHPGYGAGDSNSDDSNDHS